MRRRLLAMVLVLTAVAAPAATPPEVDSALERTVRIDHDHPSLRAVLAAEVPAGSDARQTAVRLHDFVRDRVRFGFSPRFYDQKASEVLVAGVGYCNTKSLLFVALLRAAGIPARIRYVQIDAAILDGVIDPGTARVDHSLSEVWLDGRWVSTDSYIVDLPLFRAAQARLRQENRVAGYGVHRDGTPGWDGRRDAFVQFVRPQGLAPGERDLGVLRDIDALLDSGAALNRLPWPVRRLFGFASRPANARLDALRHST